MNYIFACIQFMQQSSPRPVRSFSPHKEPWLRFLAEAQKFLQEKSVWKYPCGGWYHTADGFIVQWPGPSNHYMDHIARPDWSQYAVEYWESDEARLLAQGGRGGGAKL